MYVIKNIFRKIFASVASPWKNFKHIFSARFAILSISCKEAFKLILFIVLFSAELKPRGYYLGHFWQADLGDIGQAKIGVKVPNA